MAFTRGAKSKGTSDNSDQVAAVDKAPENGTSSQQDTVAVVKKATTKGKPKELDTAAVAKKATTKGKPKELDTAAVVKKATTKGKPKELDTAAIVKKATKKGKPKEPDTAPAADGGTLKRGRGRPRKNTSKVRDSAEPEVINQKLKAIADIEDKAAAAYADDTTPGGVAGKLPAKMGGGGHRAGSKGKVNTTVIADTSDMSELESGLDTDIEGTVRGKGKGKAQSYRMAIQALREQPLILESVAEDEEVDTAATRTEEQPIKGVKDKDTERGEEERCGNKDKGASGGDRDPTKEARMIEAESTTRAKSATIVNAEKGTPVVNNADEERDSEIEFIGEMPSLRDVDGDIDMEDVSETENGEGMKHSALPSRNANKEVVAQPVANKISINQDSGRVGGADKGKVGNWRRGKSAVEGEDVEMHDTRHALKRPSKHQRDSDTESECDVEKPKSVELLAPPRKKIRSAEPAQQTASKPQIRKNVPISKERPDSSRAERTNTLVIASDSEKETTPPKKPKTSSNAGGKERKDVAARGDKGKKGKDTDPAPSQSKSDYKSSSRMNSTSSTNTLQPPKGQRSRSASTRPQNEGLEAEDSSSEDNRGKGKDEGDCSEGPGGLSECDERDGEERKFAKESPAKGKQRLDSKALVKVEDSDEYELKPRARVTNKDLPSSLLASGAVWTKKILPTLFRWLAAQDNPWAPTAKHLGEAIQIIGRHYVDEEYILDDGTRSPEFQLVLQRFSDTWRSPIKKAALWAVITFFDSNPKFFNESDTERQNWASEALHEQKFNYGVVKIVKVRGAGLQTIKKDRFQNRLILHTFSAHFTSIKKTTWIEGLSYNEDELPRGALALATAAVEWSLTLWVKGHITVKMVREAQEQAAVKGKAPKITFPKKKTAKGTETNAYAAFNAGDWSVQTLSFLKSVMALESDDLRTIMDLSRKLARTNNNQTKDQDGDTEDSRGRIVETTFNSSEIETDESGDEKAIVPGWGDPEEEDSSGPSQSKASSSKKPAKGKHSRN